MSRLTIGIMFSVVAFIVLATFLDLPYFGDGVGVLLVGGLCYAFHVAKREAALLTYVLSEEQIIEEAPVRKPARVPQGLGNPATAHTV